MKALLLLLGVVCAYVGCAYGIALPFSLRSGWIAQSSALQEDRVSFIVALPQRNLDVLNERFWAVSDPDHPDYQQFLEPEHIRDLVAADPAAVSKVRGWLLDGGVAEAAITSFGDALEVHTTVLVASRLFSADFYRLHHADTGRKVVRILGSWSLPEHLSSSIELVTGLWELPVPSRRKRSRVLRPNADTPGIVPATIQGLYGTPASPSLSSNVSQGVIEFLEASFSPTNLQTFGIEMGPNVAAPSSDHIVGKNDPNNPDNEADLDIQYIGSVGANVPNWFWLEPDSSWMYGFALHFFNTQTVPTVISISYGYPEYFQCDPNIGNECSQYSFNNRTYVDRTNTEFQKIGLRGVSVVVASGDSGANGRLNGDCAIPRLHPDFPAASPFVTSVGATQLNSPQFSLNNAPMVCSGQGFACISSGDEVAATYDHASIVSGGGFSDYASRPSYQESVVSSYLSSGVELPPSSYFNSSGRAYPDLAAFGADILIFIGYVTPESGTSCASPIVAGAISLLNDYAISQSGKPLGFLNPLLYKMAAADSSTFSDITVGDNKCTEEGCGASCKGYVATTGWDPVTGLGSPQYPAMLSYLQKVFEARAGSL